MSKNTVPNSLPHPGGPGPAPESELRQVLAPARAGLWGVALFTGVVNILMLTGPLFMPQVHGRVLAGFSVHTLVVLFVIVVFLFGLMGILDHVRGRMLARIRAGFQATLDQRVFGVVLRQAEVPKLRDRPAGALRDLAAIQSLLAYPATSALFDLPWAPLYVAVIFLFHPWLGWFAVAGTAIVLVLAILNQRLTKTPQADGARLAAEADTRTEAARKGHRDGSGPGHDRRPERPVDSRTRGRPQGLGRGLGRRGRARRCHQGGAAAAAVGDPGAWRLAGAAERADRRRHDRRLDPARPRAGAGGTAGRALAAIPACASGVARSRYAARLRAARCGADGIAEA